MLRRVIVTFRAHPRRGHSCSLSCTLRACPRTGSGGTYGVYVYSTIRGGRRADHVVSKSYYYLLVRGFRFRRTTRVRQVNVINFFNGPNRKRRRVINYDLPAISAHGSVGSVCQPGGRRNYVVFMGPDVSLRLMLHAKTIFTRVGFKKNSAI